MNKELQELYQKINLQLELKKLEYQKRLNEEQIEIKVVESLYQDDLERR